MGKEDYGLLGEGGSDSCISTKSTRCVILHELSNRLDKVVGVSCGGWHSLFWTVSGKLFACGKGEYGRLGSGNEASSGDPVSVQLPEDCVVVKASAGGSHTMVKFRKKKAIMLS